MTQENPAPDGAKTGSTGGGGATAATPQEGGMKVDFSKVGHTMTDQDGVNYVVNLSGATS